MPNDMESEVLILGVGLKTTYRRQSHKLWVHVIAFENLPHA